MGETEENRFACRAVYFHLAIVNEECEIVRIVGLGQREVLDVFGDLFLIQNRPKANHPYDVIQCPAVQRYN